MKLTGAQIEMITKTANELKKWADNQSYNPPCATRVRLTPSWCYKKEILLLLENTNLGDKVEKDSAALDKLCQDYESWRVKTITGNNKEEFTSLVDELKGVLYGLWETLWQIVEEARQERKRWIVKQILIATSAVWGSLAALLTIFHLLGWLEPIKDFVVKMIWHK
jgi:hypothetical protein